MELYYNLDILNFIGKKCQKNDCICICDDFILHKKCLCGFILDEKQIHDKYIHGLEHKFKKVKLIDDNIVVVEKFNNHIVKTFELLTWLSIKYLLLTKSKQIDIKLLTGRK